MIARTVYRALSTVTPSQGLWDYLQRTGIVIFTGPNGSGKSLAAVASLLPVLTGDGVPWSCSEGMHRHHAGYAAHAVVCETCPGPAALARVLARAAKEGRPDPLCEEGRQAHDAGASGIRLAYSTVALIDPATGDDHPRYRPLLDFRSLVTIEHADVLFDEVAGIADAQDSGSIPVQVVQWMHTLRKSDVRLRVTTPAYSRCAKPVRQVAQAVVDARSYFPERATSGRLWRPRRMFTFHAFDATAFADFTEGTRERLPSTARAVFWRPGHAAQEHYDTLGQVLMLSHVTEHGLCSACSGTRSRPRCACPTDVPADLEGWTVEEVVTAGGSRTRRAVQVVPGEGAA